MCLFFFFFFPDTATPEIYTRSLPAALPIWMYQVLPQPIVFDADALHALAEQPEVLTDPGGIRILTPHTGELQKLLSVSDLPREKLELQAGLMAASNQIVICLKGHQTLVTDGHQATHNMTGNPGMATGGSGDVLTGIVTAPISHKLAPFDAKIGSAPCRERV